MIDHIILLNDYASVQGGSIKVAIDSAVGLAGLGKKVTYLALAGPVDECLPQAGVTVHCMGQADIWSEPNRALAMARGLWNGAGARWAKGQLAGFDPTRSVIHCHGYTRALSPAVGKVMSQSGFPYVFTMHDYALACPVGTFFHHRDRRICTRRALGADCTLTQCDSRGYGHKAWRIARQWLTHTAGRMPGGLHDIIYLSERQRQVMEPYLGPETRLHLVPNPISIARAARVKAEENDIFLFVSRLVPEKGGTLFARAAKAAGVKAVFVGDGPERAEIEAIYPEAHVTGWLSPREVEQWMAKARCLVFPSIWYETYGLAVHEALAKGLPAICGAWFAGADAIRHGKNGLIVADQQVSSWQDAIAAMQGDIASFSECAYDSYWSDATDATRHAQILLDVYERVARNQTPQKRALN